MIDHDRIPGWVYDRRLRPGWLVLAVLLAVQSCRPSPELPPDTPQALVEALVQAGVQARLEEVAGEAILGLPSRSLRIGEQQLWVHQSPEMLERAALEPALRGDQFVWTTNHMILRYDGIDGGTILLLDGLLGDPVVRPAVAGDEPYPPAIPSAIRRVAQDFGVHPAAVEVRAYEMREWADGCLEWGSAAELCAAEATPGWLIQLEIDGQAVEARSDFLGVVVRWRTP